MTILTADDHAFFQENGYLVVPGIIPKENCEAVIDAIWDNLEMDRDNPDDWYREPLRPGGMLEMYQHQAMWNNRQHPRLHQMFSEIRGTHRLWVSIDRVGMKPPRHPDHPEYDHMGFIHWDTDTSQLPKPFGLQGLLCLTDTTEDMGGFQCIPGFHRNLEAWIAEQPADRNPFAPDLSRLPEGMKPVPIPAKQGDMVLWNSLLAHGNGHNVSDRPRFSQYISMMPAPEGDAFLEQRKDRIYRWEKRLNPDAKWAPGDPRRKEEVHGTTAELTALGRKLLGLDAWE